MIALILSEQGYSVLQAENGRVARDLFLEHRDSIKLLITDLSMPEMTGSELIAEIRRIAPILPVLVCSTAVGHDQGSRFGENIRTIGKPFPLETFKRNVSEMWQRAVSEDALQPASQTASCSRRLVNRRRAAHRAERSRREEASGFALKQSRRTRLVELLQRRRAAGLLMVAAAFVGASAWTVCIRPLAANRSWTFPGSVRTHLR